MDFNRNTIRHSGICPSESGYRLVTWFCGKMPQNQGTAASFAVPAERMHGGAQRCVDGGCDLVSPGRRALLLWTTVRP